MVKRLKAPEAFEKIITIPMTDVLNYQMHEVGNPFIIKLKVPMEDDKFSDDYRHYTKSNLNVCYAAPRCAGKSRDWYETQLTVTSEVRRQNGYPYKGVPFFAVTDDGFGFLAHTSSDNNKQFAAVGDELILGRWLKGRLVKANLINPVEDTMKDTKRIGMITREILDQYGCNAIAFQKTDMRKADPNNELNSYEVWTVKLIEVSEQDCG